MNRILLATKLDFFASKSMLRLVSLMLLLAVALGVLIQGPSYAMIITVVFGVTSCGSIFPMHEKSHSDKLYGILPLKKTEMILGRYLYALIIGVVYVAIAGVLGFVLSQVFPGSIDTLAYWAVLGAAFVYFAFAVGVSYPIYFKFTFSKANIFTMLPMYLIAVGFLILTRKADLTSSLGDIINFFSAHIYLAPVIGVIIGLILLIVSLLIANLIYTHKEI